MLTTTAAPTDRQTTPSRARRLLSTRRDLEATTLVRLARRINAVMRDEEEADRMGDHRHRVISWRRLEAVRDDAARAGLVDEVEHLIRTAQRRRTGGPALRTHGDVLRRWR